MRDILDTLQAWRNDNEEIAVATVISTWGSAPRPVGAKLIATHSGKIAGSVSAGCVEGAVIDECLMVLESGIPKLLRFGVADEDAWEVGLACGGSMSIFVEPFQAWSGIFASLGKALREREPCAVVTVLEGPPEWAHEKLLVRSDGRLEGGLNVGSDQTAVAMTALSMLTSGVSGTVDLEASSTLFVEVHLPPPRLVIVGAVHIAETLVSLANTLGFDTFVIDPRSAYNTRERFPQATELISEWPQNALPRLNLDSSAYVVILTHDPKLDDPAAEAALRSGARYVGALGSRRTAEKRTERLRAAGFSAEQLTRLRSPIGLPLGGRSTAEIALSILAEVVQARNSSHITKSSTA